MPRRRQTDRKFPSEEKDGEVQENGNRHAQRRIVSIQHQQAGGDDEYDSDDKDQDVDTQEPYRVH